MEHTHSFCHACSDKIPTCWISLDPNRDRNSFEVRLCGSGSKKGHVAHDRGRTEPTRDFQNRIWKISQRRAVRRRKGVFQRRSAETSRRQKDKIFFDKVRQEGGRCRKIQPNLEDDDVEIFFQKQNLQLVERLGQIRGELQQHETQEHRNEADRSQQGQRIRGLEKTFWRAKEGKAFKAPEFKIGDSVRIHKYKSIFTKGYEPNFTSEVFKIKSVLKGDPNMYVLEDLEEEPII